MAMVPTDALFANRTPQYWTPPAQPVFVQQGISWEPLLWTAGALGVVALASAIFDSPPPDRRCGNVRQSRA